MKKISIEKPAMDYYIEEAYKTLRTNLQFCGSDKKVIVFTSCAENEGKTTVTLNLGLALAEAGKKVLLVDADMRKSALLRKVKVTEPVVGLTHFLSHQEVLTEIIYTTDVPGFNMIFAGAIAPNPTELLSGVYFEKMIKTLRETCDYILIDSPPLGSVIDSAIIAKSCDGSVIVVESGWNSWRFELQVKEQLEKTGCPILGAIINKMDITSQKYYGKYGKYGKYGRYGSQKEFEK